MTRNPIASASRIAMSAALTRPAVVPTTTERTMRPRTSSTTAAPKIVWATRSFKRPKSGSTAAVIATLVAVRVAPTNKATVKALPALPIEPAGRRDIVIYGAGFAGPQGNRNGGPIETGKHCAHRDPRQGTEESREVLRDLVR